MTYHSDLYPFQSKKMDIQGNQIHYIDEGKGSVLLFSHAPLGSSFMYRNFIKILRKKYRCIALDYPNFGLSTASSTFKASLESQSQILEAFIDRLKLNNIFILGHDTGGPSAFKVAIDHSKQFKGLVLTDTIIYPVSEYPKISRMLSLVGSAPFSYLNAVSNFLVRLTFNFGVQSRNLSKAELRQYYDLFDTKEKRRQITRMLYNLKESEHFMQSIQKGFETTLKHKPALLMYGDNDPVKEMGIADRIHHLLPNSELFLIPNEGHFPHEGQAEMMAQIIDDWMAKVLENQFKPLAV